MRGRSLITGLPAAAVVNSMEMLEALEEPLKSIFEAVQNVLERTPPELLSDLSERGIVMTGGASKLYGMDRALSAKIGLEVVVADQPEACVAIGTGRSLVLMDHFQSMR